MIFSFIFTKNVVRFSMILESLASGYFTLTFEEGLNKKRGVETGSHQQDVI